MASCLLLSVAHGLNCPAGHHWVSPHHRRAYVRGDGTLVSASDVKGHCRRNTSDYTSWYPRLRNDLPKFRGPENYEPVSWSVEETERVLEVLDGIPTLLKKLGPEFIFRARKAPVPGNPASTNLGSLFLYDVAFEPEFNLAQVMTHEFAHGLYESLSAFELGTFLSAGKWRTGQGSRKTPRVGRPESEFIRRDGMLSPAEDFADDVATYIYQPKKLKEISPSIYGWKNTLILDWNEGEAREAAKPAIFERLHNSLVM